MTDSLHETIAEAIGLRDSGRAEEARQRLMALHARHRSHPVLNLQIAWTHDQLGMEGEAVPFYETALAGDLDDEDALNAQLGLGSTLRALGRYGEAAETFDKALQQFPSDRALQVFHAMTLYNSGNAKQACENLLRLLIETTSDDRIRAYRPALTEYASDLDRSW